MKPGAPVLIRSAFPGRHEGITLCRFWPEAITALNDNYPTVLRAFFEDLFDTYHVT